MSAPEIIIIDDEARLAQFINKATAKLGRESLVANDFATVCELFHPGIRLVILDLVMPDCTPQGVMDYLAEQLPGCNLVLMSGYDDETLSQASTQAMERGLNVIGTLQKPFRFQALQELLAQLD